MFVRWKKYPLAADRSYRDDTCCPHQGPGRTALVPQLVESYREGGKVKTRVFGALGPTLRSCCVEDTADPIPRFRWWLAVQDALASLSASKRGPHAKRIRAATPDIVKALQERCPLPDEADGTLYDAWTQQPEQAPDETAYAAYCRRLAGARRACTPNSDRRLHDAALLLGVPSTVSNDDLRKAYYRAALRLHPDHGGDPAEFVAMKAAYDLLRTLRA